MKKSRKNMIYHRFIKLRKRVKVNTQRIRKSLLDNLEEIFNLAASLARGKIKTQIIDGKQVKVTLRERRAWAKVAAYTAQVMNSIAEGFDERQIDFQMDELEKLIREAKAKGKAAEIKKGTSKAEAAKDPKG